MLNFEVTHTDGEARRGQLTLNHGVVQTPIFMPCGTYGSVKGLMPATLDEIGVQILLGNTFHLMLRPGPEIMEKHNGLHGFMQCVLGLYYVQAWEQQSPSIHGSHQILVIASRYRHVAS